MNVTIKLLAIPPKQFPPGITQPTFALDVETGTRVGDILTRFQISLDGKVVLVNGRDAALNQELRADDVLALFSRVAGG